MTYATTAPDQTVQPPRRRRDRRFFEAMELAADAGLTMTTYTAEPDSADEERLHVLASWAATEIATQSQADIHQP